MNKVAFIIPVWKNDFKHLEQLLKSFITVRKDEMCDLFVVMTTEEEKKSFLEKPDLDFSAYPFIKFICLTSFTNNNNTKEHGIINAKKFYGIRECIRLNEYAYMIPIDCESYFLDLSGIRNVCDTIHNRKMFFGGRVSEDHPGPREYKLNKSCISFLKNYSNNEEDFSSIDTSIFFFWYDLPVYERKIASKFLDFIDFENISKLSKYLRWEHFDHTVYGYYCVAFHGYSIKCVKFIKNGIVKKATKDIFLKMQEAFRVSLFWTSLQHYIVEDKCFDNVKVLYHVDKELQKLSELK